MTQIAMFVDGWNFYHSLANAKISDFGWCDFKLLARQQTRLPELSVRVKYFTAEDEIRRERKERQMKTWWMALEYCGIEVIKGKFRKAKFEVDPTISRESEWREKQTDIALASHMIADCSEITRDSAGSNSGRWKPGYDHAVLLSGDTDFIPAVSIIVREPYLRRVHVLLPPTSEPAQENAYRIWNEALGTNPLACVAQLRQTDLAKALLPLVVTDDHGKEVRCYGRWMWKEKYDEMRLRQRR